MGILTSLLQMAWQHESDQRDQEIQKWQSLFNAPGIRPEFQELAIDELVNLAPKKSAGGLREIGGMFKDLIGKQRQSPGQQRLQELLAATGRPETALNIPGGSQVPPQTTTMGGGPGGPTLPGFAQQAPPNIARGQFYPGIQRTPAQQIEAPPEISTTRPGFNMSEIVQPSQSRVGPVRPSYLLSPQEKLNMQFDEMRQQANLQQDLNDIAQKRSNEIALDFAAQKQKQEFQAKREQVDELTKIDPKTGKPYFPTEEAIGIVYGKYPPAMKLTNLPKVLPGTDPALAALGADPKKFYQAIRDDSGNIVHYWEAPAPATTGEKLTAAVQTRLQSVRLAHPDWSDDRVKQWVGRIMMEDFGASVDKKEMDNEIQRQMMVEYGLNVPRHAALAEPTGRPPSGPATSAKIGNFETAAIKPGSREDLKNNYLNQLLNPTPGLRADPKGLRGLALKKGQRFLAEDSGMTPEALNAALTFNKGTAKALQTSLQTAGAFDRLQESLISFGDILNNARTKVNDTGVSTLNRWIQAGMREVPGDPDVTQLDIAVNAVARTYAQVLAGGYQSKAMPPVSSTEEARQVIASQMQTGRIAAAVSQMKIETAAEKQAMIRQQQGLYEQLRKPISEQRPGGTEGPPPPGKPGPPPPPPPGGTAKKPKTAAEFMAAH